MAASRSGTSRTTRPSHGIVYADVGAAWAATRKDSPEHDFAQKMVGAVQQLKSRPGKDIIVYGGATFVSSLIEHGLIDEMNLFVNPVAIGNGMRVFKGKTRLKLAASTAYPSGIVVNSYLRK